MSFAVMEVSMTTLEVAFLLQNSSSYWLQETLHNKQVLFIWNPGETATSLNQKKKIEKFLFQNFRCKEPKKKVRKDRKHKTLGLHLGTMSFTSCFKFKGHGVL